MYKVFLSHASEDKDFVEKVALSLINDEGMKVWYDGYQIRMGDSVREKIDHGIKESRFGVVVLSPAFFKRNWPKYELDGLLARDMKENQKVLLPIWHNVTHEDIMKESPALAGKFALKTRGLTPREVAAEIAKVVRPRPRR